MHQYSHSWPSDQKKYFISILSIVFETPLINYSCRSTIYTVETDSYQHFQTTLKKKKIFFLPTHVWTPNWNEANKQQTNNLQADYSDYLITNMWYVTECSKIS